MAKDPAFLFYSQDFIVGVQTMEFEDRGKYITILAQMHQQGRMNEKTIRFLVGSISDDLRNKFKVDEKEFWYNSRLEYESEKRNKFTKSRRDNGKKGGRPKKEEKPIGLASGSDMDSHMGIVNENEDLIIDGIEKEIADFFGFDEIKHYQQLTHISSFVNLLNDKTHFEQQFSDYKQWVDIVGKKYRKGFNKYIGTPSDQFKDGEWNNENWSDKLEAEKSKKNNGRDQQHSNLN